MAGKSKTNLEWKITVSTEYLEKPWKLREIESFCNCIDTAIEYDWFGPTSTCTIINYKFERHRYGIKCENSYFKLYLEGNGDWKEYVNYMKKCWETEPNITIEMFRLEDGFYETVTHPIKFTR